MIDSFIIYTILGILPFISMKRLLASSGSSCWQQRDAKAEHGSWKTAKQAQGRQPYETFPVLDGCVKVFFLDSACQFFVGFQMIPVQYMLRCDCFLIA